jgi:hypothetical protein
MGRGILLCANDGCCAVTGWWFRGTKLRRFLSEVSVGIKGKVSEKYKA